MMSNFMVCKEVQNYHKNGRARLGGPKLLDVQKLEKINKRSYHKNVPFFLGSLKNRSPIKVQDAIAGNECLRNDFVSFLLKMLRQNGYLSEAENSK